MAAKNHSIPPFQDFLPEPVYFRAAEMPENSEYPMHAHTWGEFVYSYSGMMEVKLDKHHFLAPSQFGLWLPPNVEHQGLNRHRATHCSFYVSEGLAHELPKSPCALKVDSFTRSILDHLRHNAPSAPYTEKELRLLEVLLDQLIYTNSAGTYLPGSEDVLLESILNHIESEPSDFTPISAIAEYFNVTERTLIRKAKRELGMTISEWRQRFKTVEAIKRLEEGVTVENIAFELGYSSSSSFITMFKKLMGTTPDDYRRGVVRK